MLGFDAIGRLALGQIESAVNGQALGAVLTIASSVIAGHATTGALASGSLIVAQAILLQGTASHLDGTIRVAGGSAGFSALTRSPRKAMGRVITVAISIIPGVATIGHEITVQRADGTSDTVTIFGASDAELCDEAFIRAVVFDDWDLWIIKQDEDWFLKQQEEAT